MRYTTKSRPSHYLPQGPQPSLTTFGTKKPETQHFISFIKPCTSLTDLLSPTLTRIRASGDQQHPYSHLESPRRVLYILPSSLRSHILMVPSRLADARRKLPSGAKFRSRMISRWSSRTNINWPRSNNKLRMPLQSSLYMYGHFLTKGSEQTIHSATFCRWHFQMHFLE